MAIRNNGILGGPKRLLCALVMMGLIGACAGLSGMEDDFSSFGLSKGAKYDLAPGIVPVGVKWTKDPVMADEKSGRVKRLVLVALNDFHGQLEPVNLKASSSNVRVNVGGAPMIAAYLKRLRSIYGERMAILDGGDMYQGSLLSNAFKGKPVVDFYNDLGVTASCIGNHEFDFGPASGDSTLAGPGEDELGALKSCIVDSRFPVLGTNVFDRRTKEQVTWARAMAIADVAGVKIGLLGLSTPETPTTTRAENVRNLHFGDMVKATKKWVPRLRAEGAEVIVVLAHSGGNCSAVNSEGSNFNPRDISKCEANTELFQYAQQLPTGLVDAIVGGHTSKRVSHFVNGIPIVETYGYGRDFSRIDLFYDVVAKRILPQRTKIHEPVNFCHNFLATSGDCAVNEPDRRGALLPAVFMGKEMVPDQETQQRFENYREMIRARSGRLLGNSRSALRKPRPKNPSTGFARFVVDAMLDSTRSYCKNNPNDPACVGLDSIDIAMTNNGCFRTDLEAGPVYFGDLYRMMPFDNNLEIVELLGKDLALLARIGSSDRKPGYQFSGLNMVFSEKPNPETMKDIDGDGSIANWERSRLLKVELLGGQAIQPDKVYRVVMHDFLGSGGDFSEIVIKRRKNVRRRLLPKLTLRNVVKDTLLKNYRIGDFEDDYRIVVE
mgnify:CR=1 FL=1